MDIIHVIHGYNGWIVSTVISPLLRGHLARDTLGTFFLWDADTGQPLGGGGGGPWIEDQGSSIKDQASNIEDQGSRIKDKDQGSRIGSRIKDQSRIMDLVLARMSILEEIRT